MGATPLCPTPSPSGPDVVAALGEFGQLGDDCADLRTVHAEEGFAVRRAAEAISGRSREDAVGRSQEVERDNDVGIVLNRLRNVYKHRRHLCWRPRLPAKAGR